MGMRNRGACPSSERGEGLTIKKRGEGDRIIALAGNPNVGKSTVFNGLTGMNQHTGNWTGKTVASAMGYCRSEKASYILVDIPGTYSLMAHSAEEVVARNFIIFGEHHFVAIVCDATCLERNLNLVLQVLEVTPNVLLCINLLDEAKRKKIRIDIDKLSERLGVRCVGVVARKKKSLGTLLNSFDDMEYGRPVYRVQYPDAIEDAVGIVESALATLDCGTLSRRFLALRLLENDSGMMSELKERLGEPFFASPTLVSALGLAKERLLQDGIEEEKIRELIVRALVESAEQICDGVVEYPEHCYSGRDRRIDRVLTSRVFGYPIMLLLLMLIFWITVEGANYPSAWLSRVLFGFGDMLYSFLASLSVPSVICEFLVNGAYRVFAWVVSVMLPPMAIFFPLFTVLEDLGYLPRIAYNLDRPFKCCRACGKQALTMCMGFGCNAVGVTGCRIIDSPRERMLAILTNSLVPCNGRFPMLIAVITMFFVGAGSGFLSAAILSLVIVLSVCATFLVTRLLSATLLRGMPSSFALELPSYRRPQLSKIVVRSFLDRTIFVLLRAVAVAIPAGAIIWIMANVEISGSSLLFICSDFLDPFARLIGLDGVILMAFILGAPANEIVVPIIVMSYMSGGMLVELEGVSELRALLLANGWTMTTAVCFIIFSLMHWPCLTTLMTIKKETGSLKWTLLSALLPTILGIVLCMIITYFS